MRMPFELRCLPEFPVVPVKYSLAEFVGILLLVELFLNGLTQFEVVNILEKEEGLDDVHVVVGGVIPQQDMEKLMDIGVKRIFPGGTRFEKAASEIKALVKK